MKLNNPVFWSFVLLVVIASLYRVMPHGIYGFPPQLAMAVFAGSIIKDKKVSFLMPLFSMLLSDGLFQLLHTFGLSKTPGFYQGQWINYLLLTSLTVFGFWIKGFKPLSILTAALAAPTFFFLTSNFAVWIGGGGYNHPKTFTGLMLTYTEALPFYYASLLSTVVFASLFFGVYYLFVAQKTAAKQPALAS